MQKSKLCISIGNVGHSVNLTYFKTGNLEVWRIATTTESEIKEILEVEQSVAQRNVRQIIA